MSKRNEFLDETIFYVSYEHSEELLNKTIFQSLFFDTYDLGLNDSAYSAIVSPATLDTLFNDQLFGWSAPQNLYNWWGLFFPSMSDLPTIPPLGIEESTFMYRICYPAWVENLSFMIPVIVLSLKNLR